MLLDETSQYNPYQVESKEQHPQLVPLAAD